MTFYGSADVGFVLIQGYNLGQSLSEISFGHSAMTEQTTGYGDVWVENTSVGLKEHTLSIAGQYKDGAGETDAAFRTSVGGNKVFCIALEGNTQGKPFEGLQGPIAKTYDRTVAIGELHKFSTEFVAFGSLDGGVILSTLAAKTASSNSTSVDNTAGTSNGGAAYLQVTDFSGFSSVTVKVQHSTNNSTWNDLVTFDAVTAANAAQCSIVAPGTTVSRYLRALWTVSGSGSATFFVGFARR